MDYLGTVAATAKRIATYSELGGGSGITRSVSTQTGSFTAGSTALIDYVYFMDGFLTLNLPTAVGNTNRYTFKNIGSFSITVQTASSQLIDGASAPIFIAADDSAIDLVSDGTNWQII